MTVKERCQGYLESILEAEKAALGITTPFVLKVVPSEKGMDAYGRKTYTMGRLTGQTWNRQITNAVIEVGHDCYLKYGIWGKFNKEVCWRNTLQHELRHLWQYQEDRCGVYDRSKISDSIAGMFHNRYLEQPHEQDARKYSGEEDIDKKARKIQMIAENALVVGVYAGIFVGTAIICKKLKKEGK